MRHGTSSRRQRGRGNGGGGGRRGNQPRMQVFDSNGPDVRIRGTAFQIVEKYTALARDSASSGDIVLHQSYLQYAEHYQRIINEFQADSQNTRDSERSGNRQEKRPNQSSQDHKKPEVTNEDLSLPSSILGDSPKAESSDKDEERTTELSSS